MPPVTSVTARGLLAIALLFLAPDLAGDFVEVLRAARFLVFVVEAIKIQ